MKLSRKITSTIGATAICAMLAIPAMTIASSSGSAQSDIATDTGINFSGTLLLTRGGNGNGGGNSNSGGGNGDQDQDRDRDGSCLDNVPATTSPTDLILAGNGEGSGDQDHDRSRDGSCQS